MMWRVRPLAIAMVLAAVLAIAIAACGPTPAPPASPSPVVTPRRSATLAAQAAATARATATIASSLPTSTARATESATPPQATTTSIPSAPPATHSPTAPATTTRPPTATTAALPTLTPTVEQRQPSPTALPPAVTVRRATITIAAYAYEPYLALVEAPAYHLQYPRLNWDAFSAHAGRPTPRDFAAIILENEYLRLTVLPELGGRIYEVIFTPTGHSIFYKNAVLKPTRWGHETQGWWLAAGGIEWCLPVEEHGYEWGQEWDSEIAQTADQATVTVWDTRSADRLRARVAITLSAGRSYVTVSPRIENPTTQPVRYQFWLNAMLASGGTNHVSEATEFILPASEVTVHSTGDRTLPQAGQAMTWPMFGGRAMNLYGTWRSYLGVFARPQAQRGFVGIYDNASEEGVLRIYPPALAAGVKLFGGKGLDPLVWTDDGSTYVEIHGGVTPTFADYATLAAGAAVGWSEQWYPFAQIGPVVEANADAALSLQAVQGGYRLGVAVTAARSGRLVLAANGSIVWSQDVTLDPEHSFVQTVNTAAGGVTLRLEDRQGRVLVEH